MFFTGKYGNSKYLCVCYIRKYTLHTDTHAYISTEFKMKNSVLGTFTST